jgi:RNA polymerase sigma-32 factor
MAQLDGVPGSFIRAARNAPYLEREQERALTLAWASHKDQAALHKLAEAHMRLVIAVAAKFRNYGLSAADLIQEGHVGLLEAAVRFDPEREVRFSTYATWWIRAAIQDYVLKNWSIVRGGTSSAQKSLFFNLRRLRATISQAAGPHANSHVIYTEIATALGVSHSDVTTMAARLSGADASLNAPVMGSDGEEGAERGDAFHDHQPLPDELVQESIDSERRLAWLNGAMTVLNPREAEIIRQRRLLDDSATLESLGHILGISKERVRQIENRAMEKLKAALLARHPDALGAIS